MSPLARRHAVEDLEGDLGTETTNAPLSPVSHACRTHHLLLLTQIV